MKPHITILSAILIALLTGCAFGTVHYNEDGQGMISLTITNLTPFGAKSAVAQNYKQSATKDGAWHLAVGSDANIDTTQTGSDLLEAFKAGLAARSLVGPVK